MTIATIDHWLLGMVSPERKLYVVLLLFQV